MLRALRLISLLLLALCVLPAARAAPPAAENGITVALIALPPHLNPLTRSEPAMMMPAAQLFASPVRFDGEGRPQPYLAERWEEAPDGLAITLHLAPQARFHDGRPVTAEDVAFSLTALREQHPFAALYEAIERVETPDAHTAVVRLRHKHPALMLMLSPIFAPVLPRHVYGDGQPLASHPANHKPVGSGPFRLKQWEPGRTLLLERNPEFFLEGRPQLDFVRFKPVGLGSDLVLELMQRQVDLAGLMAAGAPGFEELEKKPFLQVTRNRGGAALMVDLGFNLKAGPLADPRVRRAIAYAADRERIIAMVRKGRDDIPAPSPLPPGSPFFSDEVNHYPFDAERANALLDEAGYPRDSDGKRFSLTFDYLPSDAGMAEFAEYLRFNLLRSVGIDLQIHHPTDFGDWARRFHTGEYQLNVWVRLVYGDPLAGFHRSFDSRAIKTQASFVNQGYRNPEVDELLTQAAAATDHEQRKRLYARIQRILMEDLPIFPISELPTYTVFHRELSGVTESSWYLLAPYDRLRWREGRAP